MIDVASGRARIPAGRLAWPIDEDSIPPVVIRPARSRARTERRAISVNEMSACELVGPASSRAVSLRLSMKIRYLQLSYGPRGVGPYPVMDREVSMSFYIELRPQLSGTFASGADRLAHDDVHASFAKN